ncbi:MAG: hypothetical protein WDA60_01570 [Acidimicrobiia bacterium]
MFVAAVVAAAALAVPLGGLASAGGGYGSQPGFDNAITNSDGCAGHGAFGAFGTTGDVVHDFGVNHPGSNGKPGASSWQFPGAGGGTTGGNNNSLCGGGNVPAPFAP